MKTALKWGCPFILFWEMYNNELTEDGSNRGFWLIDKYNKKTPLYYTHQNFYKESRTWVKEYYEKNGKMPSHNEFVEAAVGFNSLN